MTKRPLDQGGYLQQLAAPQAMEEPTQPSKLARALLEKWSWGTMSAPEVQALAAAACSDGLLHPSVVKLSNIGAKGRFPGNTHRDLLKITGQDNVLLESVSTYQVRVQVKKNVSKEIDLQFLLPHKLFSTLYHSLPQAFRDSLLGGKPTNIGNFWDAMQHHPNLLARPELQGRPDLKKIVPLALHGDGVAYMQANRAGSKSLEVLSWCSLLSRGPTKANSFLMFALCKTVVKEGVFSPTWSRVWKILTWSLEALAEGRWPLSDWEGKPFDDETSVDFLSRGKPLVAGYSAVVFVVRADLEFLSNHFKLNSPASNNPCTLCRADRQMTSMPWTDCRWTAAWRGSVWVASEWAEANPNCHVFFKMAGSGLDLVFPDLMHTKHLGTDQVLLGSVLSWLIKHYLGGTVAENLEVVWDFIQSWFKDLS